MCAYQPSRLCECCAASWRPAPVVMRITSGTLNWPPDMCSSVAALFMIWSRASRLKLTVMISTIGRIPPSAAPMPGADERRLRQRRVADPLGPELLEQALADREAAAVAADVLAHEEHPLVAPQRLADRLAHRLAVGGLLCQVVHVVMARLGLYTKRVRSSTGSSGAGLGERDRGVDLGRRPRRSMRRQRRRRSARPRRAAGAPAASIGSRSLPLLDLGLVAVELGVVHRVRAEPVGAQLEEVRAAAAADRARRRAGRPARPRARPCRRPPRPASRSWRPSAPGRSRTPSGRARCPSRRGCSRSRTAPAAATARRGSCTRGTRPRRPRPRRRSRR